MINVYDPIDDLPVDLRARSSLPGPINYEAERLNAQHSAPSSIRQQGQEERFFVLSFLFFFFERERSSTNFLRDSTRDLFPRVDGVTGLRFPMSRDTCQERAKLKILHDDRGSVSLRFRSIGTFSKSTALESAHWRIIYFISGVKIFFAVPEI